MIPSSFYIVLIVPIFPILFLFFLCGHLGPPSGKNAVGGYPVFSRFSFPETAHTKQNGLLIENCTNMLEIAKYIMSWLVDVHFFILVH